MSTVGSSVEASSSSVFNNVIMFIPNFISGLVILAIGWFVATIVKQLILKGITILNPEKYLSKAHFSENHPLRRWPTVIAEVGYWFVLLTFLIPAFNAWQLPMITNVLSQFLFYIPNILAAVIIGFIGLVLANLAFDIVKNAAHDLGSSASNILAKAAKYSLVVITVLMALNQLGVGAVLIQILLAGFVLMIALAGGLAFGLGGQDTARALLSQMLISNKRRTSRPVAYTHDIRQDMSRPTVASDLVEESHDSQTDENVAASPVDEDKQTTF